MKQIKLIKSDLTAYGGELLKTRKGRSRGRPIDSKRTMHLVLRSSKARGAWSFRSSKNAKRISEIIQKFSSRYNVRILSLANVGNHLHFHIQLTNRQTYKPFIRAITSAIAMAVTGVNRWSTNEGRKIEKVVKSSASMEALPKKNKRLHFWDCRPFTRVITSFRELLNLKDYIQVNQLEGLGYSRTTARSVIFKNQKKLLLI